MRTRTIMAMLAATTFSLAGLGSASASNDSAHRPMKASTSSEYVFVDLCGDSGLLASIEGTGNMTHLGRVAYAGTNCVTLITPDAGNSSDGRMTFTAANGDELYATFSGRFGPTNSEGFVPVVFDMVFDGGTGRFTDATGEMTGKGLLTPTTETTTWSGWIAY